MFAAAASNQLQTIAGDLYRRRRAMGLSRPVLARRLEVSAATIEEWEAAVSVPTALQLIAWCIALYHPVAIGPAGFEVCA